MTNENELVEEELFDDDMDDALSLDDMSTGYLANPKVGESITFKLKKVIKLKGNDLVGKKRDGTTFEKNLSKVDYGIEVVCDNANKYTVSSWEVWGKMKSILQKLQVNTGVEFRITHLLDGMKPENRKQGVDLYKVEALVEGEFRSLNRDTKEWVVG